MTLSDGTTTRTVYVGDAVVSVVERPTDNPATPDERTVIFVGSEGAPTPLEMIEDLPSDLRVVEVLVPDAGVDVRATLDVLGFGDVHLVGWDSGAATAIAYAALHRVRSLSLLLPSSASERPEVTLHSADAPPVLWLGATDAHTATRRALLRQIGYIGPAHDPAPPTETIILKSAD